MNVINYKGINEDLSIANLEGSQRHILTTAYKNKVRELINVAVNNGDDISVDDEGNILCLQTKFYIRKYEWDPRIQDFVKVRTKSRKVRLQEDVADNKVVNEEQVEELVEDV